ncbi:hypothetical protein [[Pseudomonas] boreopolis]|uniref:hypothetical protein n=1 Tax=Xanthomonas boreopolis TaxID=86183 RepID=UPI003D9BC531
MTSHSAAVKRFFGLLFFTRHILVPRPSGRLRRAAPLLRRACTSKDKVTRRKAKAFAAARQKKQKQRPWIFDPRPSGIARWRSVPREPVARMQRPIAPAFAGMTIDESL